MKLPRWLVLALMILSALAAASFAGWWWVTWPSRAVREFTYLVQRGRFDESNRFLELPHQWTVEEVDGGVEVFFDGGPLSRSSRPAEFWIACCSLDNLELESRSFGDLLLGRRSFSFHRQFATPFFIGGYVARGTVHLRCEPWAAY